MCVVYYIDSHPLASLSHQQQRLALRHELVRNRQGERRPDRCGDLRSALARLIVCDAILDHTRVARGWHVASSDLTDLTDLTDLADLTDGALCQKIIQAVLIHNII